MKTKILIAFLAIGLFSTATVIAQEKKEMKMNHSKMEMKKDSVNEMYTCSMHPDVKSDKPGECPKCGMKLMKKKMEMKEKQEHKQ